MEEIGKLEESSEFKVKKLWFISSLCLSWDIHPPPNTSHLF